MEQSNGIKITIMILLAVCLVISPVYSSQRGSASKAYELKGVGKGTISCPDGSKVNNARISFFVFHQNDGTFAEWNVDQKTFGSQGGIFTKESIDLSKYNLNGVEAFDNICGSKVPVKVSLSGSCGDGSKAKLQGNKGEKAIFKVRAQCKAVQ
ncbi:MAG: hypothetical protein M3O24_01750 [Thermoproteota archaeon]|nr:hypothetical protein [Thermoproteota archaeon]